MASSIDDNDRTTTGTAAEVFVAFLALGLSAFGGPVAHLGYFREAFVRRRRWLDEAAYADLLALCQFLPGPASSQAGFALGVLRQGGLAGGLAAWLGFTAPSALIMLAAALLQGAMTGPFAAGLLHGLKLVAAAVVAQAVWGMARSLAPDRSRAAIVIAAVLIVTLLGGSVAQIAAIAFGAFAGLALCRAGPVAAESRLPIAVGKGAAVVALALFAGLLVGLPMIAAATDSRALDLADTAYRAGALVFGGGHVVLPLLDAGFVGPGLVSEASFLSGYGVAQALPGPLFTFAAFLGASAAGVAGGLIALVAIFLPGLLLVYGALHFWEQIRARPLATAALRGANAAVVGVLAAALYDPIWTSAVTSPLDFALALTGFLLLTVWSVPPWAIVLVLAAAGVGSTIGMPSA